MGPERSARGDARRADVVDIARRVLIDDGLDRFVMRDIACRAGMKLGNLQYYFTTRADLLEAVIRAEFDRDVAAVRHAADVIDHDRSTPEEEFAALGKALLRNWLADGGGSVFATLSLLSYHDERFRLLNREIYESFYAELGEVIRRVNEALDDSEIRARVRLITSLIDGVAVQTHATAAHDALSRNELLDRASALITAIANGSVGSPRPG